MELKLSEEQVDSLLNIKQWDKSRCLDMMAKLVNRLQSIEKGGDTPAPKVAKKPKVKDYMTHSHWSKNDKLRLKEKFLLWKGKMTDNRFKMLMKMFKRSKGAVYAQIMVNREEWLKEVVKKPAKTHFQRIPKVKTMQKIPPKPEPEPVKRKQDTTKARKRMQWVAKKGGELMRQGMKRPDAWSKASQMYQEHQKGDAHTQAEPSATQQEVQEQVEIPFPRIYPLSQTGNQTLMDVLKDLVYNPSKKFTYSEAQMTLQLASNLEWNPKLWEQFCDQVRYNSDAMTQFYNVSGSFDKEYDGQISAIKYKRG